MKYFLAIALIATVASATYIKPAAISAEEAEIQEIIAAINNPSTNPATAAALEEMLLDVLGLNPEPVAVGPAIVEASPEPISVGPAVIDFPLPDGGALTEQPADVSPVIVGPAVVAEDAAPSSAPLVQIILNINQAAADSTPAAPVAVAPVAVAQPEPVNVVDTAVDPVQVVDSAPISPIQVVEISPIQVVETAPVAVEPVVIGTPVLPSPAVVLPEELN